MKKFNNHIFLVSTILFGFLSIPIFLASGAADEGTIGTNLFWIFFSKLSFLIEFPIFTILGTLVNKMNTLEIILLILCNVMFYGLVIERIVSVFKTNKKQ